MHQSWIKLFNPYFLSKSMEELVAVQWQQSSRTAVHDLHKIMYTG